MNIAAGIVLYNPDIDRLEQNINAIIMQCDIVYLVDNGSNNIKNIRQFIQMLNNDKCVLIENKDNKGIAYALNQMTRRALMDKYNWILTLDQDSICPDDIILEYSKYIKIEKIGMICPYIQDLNKANRVKKNNSFSYVKECITSGSMLNINAWKNIGGFDEKMFIDGVDFDICHRLIKYGYFILRAQNVILLHELGHCQYRKFLIWKVLAKNHSSFRKYYISRNTIYLARKEQTSILRAICQNIKLLLVSVLYEKNKCSKIKNIIKGTIDGFTI